VTLIEKVQIINDKIEKAKIRGRVNQTVNIVAVTKTHPFSIIEQSYKAGVFSIGENRIQESKNKFRSFNSMPKITKRFIGHLQSNKVNKCIELFDTIDSVDSIKLLKKISNSVIKHQKKISVLLEINTSGEISKRGFKPNEISEIKECLEIKNIDVNGLMTIGPNTNDKNKIRKSFQILRKIKQTIKNPKLQELSMGMSGDYEIAVEEGSTMVRLGTALFGKRT
tara:strand:- start:1300 stop:1971 length:672 start_codon:yes stop_codon:yes gene_type:complete